MADEKDSGKAKPKKAAANPGKEKPKKAAAKKTSRGAAAKAKAAAPRRKAG